MKNTFLSLLLATGILGLSGCQTINTMTHSVNTMLSENEKRFYNNIQNTSIRDAFFYTEVDEKGIFESILAKPLIAAGYNLKSRTTTSLYLINDTNWNGTYEEAIADVKRGRYNSEKDLAAKYYVDQARKNGHSVRVYKSSISYDVNAGLKQKVESFNGAVALYGSEPVFVEFDKDQQPVSIMTRSWLISNNIGTTSQLVTNIYFGRDATQWFSNRFSNSYLNNAIMKVYK
ncbi:hypothetical protein HLH17_06875 [Acinetobacter sp. ANC 5380]|uniref:Uncharacterized protein n=1 Tax=Acinetobacter terrae TaxID=2731247 RepID=A0A7Y2RFA4_9GAMM|nr:hypothetical protein [Acinetobacter terrae]NNH77396.1 hypothetical protein [Acinetobacter terrae]